VKSILKTVETFLRSCDKKMATISTPTYKDIFKHFCKNLFARLDRFIGAIFYFIEAARISWTILLLKIFFHLSSCMSISTHFCPFRPVSAYLPICPSAHLPICPSAHLPICPSARLPICPSAHLLV
jgi:hypothetical protein